MFRQMLFLSFVLFASIQARSTENDGNEFAGPVRKCPKGTGDQALNQCIEQVVRDVLGVAKSGNAKLGLEPLDPLTLDKIVYDWGFDKEIQVTVNAKNIKFHKLTNIEKIQFSADSKKHVLNFTLEIPTVGIVADYKLGGNVFFFPLIGGGPAEIRVEQLKMSGHMHFHKVTNENGEKVIQIEKTSIEVATIKNMHVRLRGLFEGIPTLSGMIHMIANRYGPLIFDFIRPTFDVYIGDIFQNRIFNPVLTKLPFIADFVPNI